MTTNSRDINSEARDGQIEAFKTSGTSPTDERTAGTLSDVEQIAAPVEGVEVQPQTPRRQIIGMVPSQHWFASFAPSYPFPPTDVVRLIAWALVLEPDGQQRVVGVCPTGLADESPGFTGYFDLGSERNAIPDVPHRHVNRCFPIGTPESMGGAQ